MVFFFEKDAVELQLETYFDPETRRYTVVRRQSDGEVFTQEVVGEEPCRLVLRKIESDLELTGWRRSRPPELIDPIAETNH